MALTLYRRHTASCPVRKSRLSAKAKRLAMECACPIWIYGRTETQHVPRQSTGLTDLTQAEALRDSYTAKGKDEAEHGPRLEECVARYLESRKSELGLNTQHQYRLLLDRLKDYCAKAGVYFMRELTVDLLETFKVDGLKGLTDTSKTTTVGYMRAFLKDSFRRGWLLEPLVYKVKPYKSRISQKEPYTEEEVVKILDGAETMRWGKHAYAKHPRTFRLLLELMLETGMRVGDATRYDPRLAVRGERLWIYSFFPQKQRRDKAVKRIDTFIPDRLKQAIDECKWLSKELPFSYSNYDERDTKRSGQLSARVWKTMRSIGKRVGVSDCRPHRLRDTFAVRKLLSGFQLEDVQILLGHSSVKITETYYAKWTSGRARRLERLMAQTQSFVNPGGDGGGDR